MNSDKQDKNQRLRMAQSLYRKKKRKNIKRDKDSEIWTVFIWMSILFAFLILITIEVFYLDRGVPIPEFLSKLAATFNLIFFCRYFETSKPGHLVLIGEIVITLKGAIAEDHQNDLQLLHSVYFSMK